MAYVADLDVGQGRQDFERLFKERVQDATPFWRCLANLKQ